MKKIELVSKVAKKTGLQVKQTELAFNAIFEEISNVMAKKDKLSIVISTKYRITVFSTVNHFYILYSNPHSRSNVCHHNFYHTFSTTVSKLQSLGNSY